MSAVDLTEDRAPVLYAVPGRPPLDAWDVQIAAPPPLVAWLEVRRHRGLQSGIYIVGAGAAITTVAAAFPGTALSSEHHVDAAEYPHPHVHVMLAAQDLDGRPLQRDQVQTAATEAWVAHVQRMIDYARERPHLELHWRADATITGIDHTGVPPFTCREFDWLEQPPVFPAL